MTSYRIRTAALLGLLTMTGCAPGPIPPAAALSPDQMAVMVMSAGGMVPSVISAMQSPALVIYGDGTALTALPAPALRAVPARYEVARVDPDQVRQFVTEAQSSGLLGAGTDFGSPRATDLATTTVLVRGDEQTAQVRVYALNPRFETGLSTTQREARDRLRTLIERASALPAAAARQPYSPERITVSEIPPGRNQDPATVVWPGPPLPDFLAPSATRRSVACGELTGTTADVVYRAALENPGAGWLVGGTTRVLAVNPLPVEACDG
ncbi:MAG: hypothetical protein KDB50_06425 [Mycobacterium sp.]|nr:hypothetical protein [Mycobacterium sp.]